MLVISGKGNGEYKKASFMVENNGPFIGWTDRSKASGWDCPVFEKEDADLVMNDYNKDFDNDDEKASYDESTDTYIFSYDDGLEIEVEHCKGFMINTPDGEKKVYAIGNGWVWEQFSKEVEED
jgi:hypothetical protein